jgi:DNA-binding MurR/RpiR family transcriptional regulator
LPTNFMSSIQEIINANYDSLTAQERKIAEFIINSTNEAPFLSISKVARRAGTSGASVIRFCRHIGFEGYNDFQNHLRKSLSFQKSTANLFNSALTILKSTDTILINYLEREINNLSRLPEAVSEAQMTHTAQLICEAKRLVIFGEGPMVAPTWLLEHRLRRFRIDIMKINETGKDLFDKAFTIKSGDCLLLFVFLRFSEEAGILLSQARRVGAKIIFITDLRLTKAKDIADECLQFSRGSCDFFQSIVTPVVIAETITLEVGHHLGENVSKSLLEFEKFRKSYGYPRTGLEIENREIKEEGKNKK